MCLSARARAQTLSPSDPVTAAHPTCWAPLLYMNPSHMSMASCKKSCRLHPKGVPQYRPSSSMMWLKWPSRRSVATSAASEMVRRLVMGVGCSIHAPKKGRRGQGAPPPPRGAATGGCGRSRRVRAPGAKRRGVCTRGMQHAREGQPWALAALGPRLGWFVGQPRAFAALELLRATPCKPAPAPMAHGPRAPWPSSSTWRLRTRYAARPQIRVAVWPARPPPGGGGGGGRATLHFAGPRSRRPATPRARGRARRDRLPCAPGRNRVPANPCGH